MSRLEKLKEMLEQDPADTFVRYGLAMEYRGEEQYEEATRLFDGLIADRPPHVPSYFMKAQMLADMEQVAEARSTLELGIAQAKAQDNLHAAGEMSELLASLE